MMKIRKSQDGSHTEEMVGLATWGVYDAINPPETISPDGRVPSVRYPNLRFEFPRLQVTVHTDSLALAQDQDSQARDWIVAMGKGIAPRETSQILIFSLLLREVAKERNGHPLLLLRHTTLNVFRLLTDHFISFH